MDKYWFTQFFYIPLRAWLYFTSRPESILAISLKVGKFQVSRNISVAILVYCYSKMRLTCTTLKPLNSKFWSEWFAFRFPSKIIPVLTNRRVEKMLINPNLYFKSEASPIKTTKHCISLNIKLKSGVLGHSASKTRWKSRAATAEWR